MRRAILLLTLVGAILLACSGVVLAQQDASRNDQQESTTQGSSSNKAPVQKPDRGSIPGQYIVVLKDDTSDAAQVANDHARKHGFTPDFIYKRALKGYAAKLSDAQLDKVRSESQVQFVSLDHQVQAVDKTDSNNQQSATKNKGGSTSQESTSQQSSSSEKGATAQGTVPIASGDSGPTGVRRIGAATTATVHQASNANVAVIDTGISLSHPDLNAVNGKNCVRTRRTAEDDNGHGSHVSGTIAAKNNGSGVVGVAPGTKLYAVKVLNSSGSGTWSQVICGIDWVTANAAGLNIKVANMSLGGGGSNDNNCGNSNSDALHKAVCNSANAGVTYAVAAGNSNANFASSSPAAYPEVLTVTAVSDSDGAPGGTGGAPTCRTGETDDSYASFSNYAVAQTEINHTIAGPGVCIYSTWKGTGYNTISGTSMATPHLAGTVALCVGNGGAKGPCAGLSPAQIIQQLRSDAQAYATSTNGFNGDPFHLVSGKYYGYLTWDGNY